MRSALLLFLFLIQGALAQSVLLRNDREGTSFYIKKRQSKKIKSFIQRIDKEIITQTFQTAQINLKNNYQCSLPLYKELVELGEDVGIENKASETKLYLLSLRSQNLIDDIGLMPLLKINKTSKKLRTSKTISEKGFTEEELEKAKAAIKGLKQDLSRRSVCISSAVQKMIQKYFGAEKVKDKQIKKLLDFAFTQKVINKDQFQDLDLLRKAKVYEWNLLLGDYIQKKRVLRAQYPLERGAEYSDLVTEKYGKKQTRRGSLYQKYNYIQIITMGNVIQELRSDFDSSKMEILVYDRDGLEFRRDELEPMERFRYAIKRLRKRMTELQNNFLFENAPPSYIDLILSAYEIGLITAEELDEVAKIEEIWNPKKTFWDKYGVWIKTAGSIGSIILPPPFGFIPMLAIVIIEATTKKEPKSEYNHSVFGL